MDGKKPSVLSAEWLSAEEVMHTLGIARRTLQTWAQGPDPALHWKQQLRPGRQPERVYSATDVQKLKEQGGPPRQRREPKPKPETPKDSGTAVAVRPRGELITLETARELAKLLAPVQGVSVAQKLWLTVEEAMMYSQFGKSYLMRLVRDKKIEAVKGGPGGRWLIQRKSLEAFEG